MELKKFSKEIANPGKHSKKCLLSLATRELQVKTTLRSHIIPIRTKGHHQGYKWQQMLAWMRRKGNPDTLLMGLLTGASTLDITLKVPQNARTRSTM